MVSCTRSVWYSLRDTLSFAEAKVPSLYVCLFPCNLAILRVLR